MDLSTIIWNRVHEARRGQGTVQDSEIIEWSGRAKALEEERDKFCRKHIVSAFDLIRAHALMHDAIAALKVAMQRDPDQAGMYHAAIAPMVEEVNKPVKS